MKDPRVRKDGKCAVCKKPRQPERSRKYARTAAEVDPFCSIECCRAYHATPYPTEHKTGRAKGTKQYYGVGVPHGTLAGYRLCACELCRQAMADAKAAG